MKTELLPRISRVEDLAAIRGPGPVLLAGSEHHVAALLRHVLDTGRVAAFLPPKYYSGGVAVAVSLRPLDVPAPVRWTRRISRPVVVAAVTTGMALTAALAWVMYAAVAWIVGHIAAVLVVAAALAVLAGVAGPRTCRTVVTIIHRH